MKKDKSKKQAPAEFNNNPFRSLKTFKSAPDSAHRSAPPKRKETVTQEDEAALFLRAVSDARVLHEKPQVAQAQAPTGTARHDEPEEQQLFLLSMKKLGTTFRAVNEDEDDDTPRQSASSRMKQLRRGAIQISEELDLHGFVRDEALFALGRFIAGAYSRGRKAVLVITGKGVNSADGPVLQGAVAEWLRNKGKGMVAEFAPAPRDKGGSGAFVVFLKTKER